MHICTKCSEQKPNSEFSKNNTRKTGRNSYCKSCHKEYVAKHYQENKETYLEKADNWKTTNPQKRKDVANKYARSNPEKQRNNTLKRQYGITLEEFNKKVLLQENKCIICDATFKNLRDACMDHCHKSKKVRDVLCRTCNSGLGHFKDSIQNLKSAIQYLIKHQS